MHRLGAGAKRGRDELLRDEVALRRGLAAEREGLVGVRARGARRGRRPSRRRPSRSRARAASGRPGSRSRPGSRRALSRRGPLAHILYRRGPRRSADRRAHPRGAGRDRPLRLELPRPRLLGDGRLRRRDGDRLVRRPDRAPEREDLGARLAARPDRRQDPRDVGARRARRRGRVPGLDGGADRRARVLRLRAAARGDRARRRRSRCATSAS